MVRTILPVFILSGASAYGAVVHVPVKSNVALKPNESYTITVEATEPIEIGWKNVQAKPCAANCVQATDITGGINYSIAVPLGASMKYKPVGGKITIEYRNIAGDPVTIDIYKVRRTCEAEACRVLDEHQKSRWLVFKVDEFKSITTSADGSYSVISGVAASGRPFTFRAVWWTDEKPKFGVDCSPSVKRYLDSRTPKDQYSPYVISGQAIGEPSDIVLKSIETCAPKAPKFGVPDENVFR